MSKIYGSNFRWGIIKEMDKPVEGLNSCFVQLDWASLMPAGDKFDPEAFAKLRELLENYILDEIRPIVLLGGENPPSFLKESGGWENRATAQAFADYARLCFSKLSDCVDLWVTFRELPQALFAFDEPTFSASVGKAPLQAIHHMLVGHGMAVDSFKKGGYDGKIGIGLTAVDFLPASPSKADRDAARTARSLCENWIPRGLTHGLYPLLSSLKSIAAQTFPISKKNDPFYMAQVIDFAVLSFRGKFKISAGEGSLFFHQADDEMSCGAAQVIDRMYKKMKLPIYVADLCTAENKKIDSRELVFSRLASIESLLLSWVDIRGYYIPLSGPTPAPFYKAMLEYIAEGR